MGDIRSLCWLSRWHNGRSDRIQEIHDEHLSNLYHLVLPDVGNLPIGKHSIQLCGFDICISINPSGFEIVSIKPPENLDVFQLELFIDDEELVEITA